MTITDPKFDSDPAWTHSSASYGRAVVTEQPFETYDIHLAAFLLERGQHLETSFLKDGSVYFQFLDRAAAEPLQKAWLYDKPQVSIRDYLTHLNACRDLLRVHKGSGRR